MRFYLLPEKFDYIPGQREIDPLIAVLKALANEQSQIKKNARRRNPS